MISCYDQLRSKTFSTYHFTIQEDLIERISLYVSVSENKKIDLVQKITDVQAEDN